MKQNTRVVRGQSTSNNTWRHWFWLVVGKSLKTFYGGSFLGLRAAGTILLLSSIAHASGGGIVYVSEVGGVTEVNSANNSVIATAPFADNANGVAVTPNGRRLYATDRDVPKVVVFDTTTNVPVAQIPIGNGPLGLAVSPDGSRVYATNQFDGTVSVISTSTNTVVATIPTGLEPIWVTFSRNGSRAYVSNQVSGTISVVATAFNSVVATIPGFSCPFQSAFVPGSRLLLISSQCDNTVKVVDTNSNSIVNSIDVGPNPRGISFSADGSRAYVADFGGNTVDVLDVSSQTNLGTPIQVGTSPWGIATAANGLAYVANFGDGTISVINTSTNTVAATLPARSNPEDVTISRTAQPRILNYAFQSIAPPGSPYSLVRHLNNRGDAVGDYYDSSWGGHGFFRANNGQFVNIDPPGSIATSAFGINDTRTIVGAYIDGSGALHGFKRSPTGTYTTVDAPGFPDSQLTGINNFRHMSGVYDLGNRASTNCASPSCQAVGFLLRSGAFTAFEDPNAAPNVTFAMSINDLDQICGLFMDAGGSTLGFVRNPLMGSFRTIQFPTADTFSYVSQINDVGILAGEYIVRFEQGFPPEQGFLTDGTHAFSFDYPNSQSSGLKAVNDLGEVGGFFTDQSGRTQAYIATLVATQNQQ